MAVTPTEGAPRRDSDPPSLPKLVNVGLIHARLGNGRARYGEEVVAVLLEPLAEFLDVERWWNTANSHAINGISQSSDVLLGQRSICRKH